MSSTDATRELVEAYTYAWFRADFDEAAKPLMEQFS
jgi:hypothetical protein